MKYSKLKEVVKEIAEDKRLGAGFSGSWGDGGASVTLKKLDEFKQKLVVKYDLRPSEFNQLEDKEVGEPKEFYEEIRDFKNKLAQKIKL